MRLLAYLEIPSASQFPSPTTPSGKAGSLPLGLCRTLRSSPIAQGRSARQVRQAVPRRHESRPGEDRQSKAPPQARIDRLSGEALKGLDPDAGIIERIVDCLGTHNHVLRYSGSADP